MNQIYDWQRKVVNGFHVAGVAILMDVPDWSINPPSCYTVPQMAT